MIDKREWRRVETSFEAQCQGDTLPLPLDICVVNMNPRGFCFSGPQEFYPGDVLTVSVNFPGEKLSVQVSVVWSGFVKADHAFHTGVSVDSLPPAVHDSYLFHYNACLARARKLA